MYSCSEGCSLRIVDTAEIMDSLSEVTSSWQHEPVQEARVLLHPHIHRVGDGEDLSANHCRRILSSSNLYRISLRIAPR